MNSLPSVSPSTPGVQRKVAIAACFGTFLEWYDFLTFASLATYFSTLFFLPDNPTTDRRGIDLHTRIKSQGHLLRCFGQTRRGRRVASDEKRNRALGVRRHKVESQQATLLESLCMKATQGLTSLAPTMKATCVRITTPRGTGWATMAAAPHSAAVRRQGATDA